MADNWKDIRALLLKMGSDLDNEIKARVQSESNDTLKGEVGDIYDLASDERDRELNFLISDREREKLAEIEESLRCIEDGTYGICEECEGKIPKKRLMIMPFTRLCVQCKSEMEKSRSPKKEFKEEREYRKLAFTGTEEEEN